MQNRGQKRYVRLQQTKNTACSIALLVFSSFFFLRLTRAARYHVVWCWLPRCKVLADAKPNSRKCLVSNASSQLGLPEHPRPQRSAKKQKVISAIVDFVSNASACGSFSEKAAHRTLEISAPLAICTALSSRRLSFANDCASRSNSRRSNFVVCSVFLISASVLFALESSRAGGGRGGRGNKKKNDILEHRTRDKGKKYHAAFAKTSSNRPLEN